MPRKRRSKSSAGGGSGIGKHVLSGGAFGFIVFVISVAVVMFVALSKAKSYVRSDDFRSMIETQLSKLLKAEGTMDPITWEDNSSAFTDTFRAEGYEDAGFYKLKAAGMRAQVDLSREQFKRGVWSLPEITLSQLDVVLKPERLNGTYEQAHPKPPVMKGAEPKSNFFSDLVPKNVEVGPTRISNTNIYFEEGETKVQAVGARTELEYKQANQTIRIRAWDGTLKATQMESVDLVSLDVNWRLPGDFYITQSTLGVLNGAQLDLEGDVQLGNESKPGTMNLQADLVKVDLKDLVSGAWQQRLQGEISMDASIEGDPAKFGEAKQEGSITLNKGVIEDLPVLDVLANYTRNERFRRVALRNGASANFVRQGQRTEINDINVQSDGLAQVKGDLVIDRGNLSGQLKVGVVPGTLAGIPGAERKVFDQPSDGHLWADVTVSGTVAEPKHDLVDQLAAAGVEAAVEKVQEVLTNPESAPDAVDEAIGVGTGILRGLFGN